MIGGLGAALVFVAAGLAGCASTPPGVDGDLTNGWATMPVAKVAVPVVGVCYPDRITDTWIGDFTTVPCTDTHQTETVFVGSYPTGGTAPPTEGGQDQANAYGQCQKGATAYLGGDYHTGSLELLLLQPSSAAWTGGARWFRCDIVRFSDAHLDTIDRSAGSVKGGLSGSRPLAVTCKTATEDGKGSISSEELTDCAKPHNAELAGLFTPPNLPWQDSETARDDIGSKGCEAVVAKYLGFTGTEVDNQYLGWEYSDFSQHQWSIGDRTIQCFALGFKGDSPNGARFVGSVKGIKGGKPKSWA
jgi:hypothetical protein